MPRKNSITVAAAGTANNMPNFLILTPMENRPQIMVGRQVQMVKIQQNSNIAPFITTGGGSVPNLGGKLPDCHKTFPC